MPSLTFQRSVAEKGCMLLGKSRTTLGIITDLGIEADHVIDDTT